LVACHQNLRYSEPEEIVIAGEILNYKSDSDIKTIAIYINDNGTAEQLNFPTKIDQDGHFCVHFKRYYPQDVMVSFKTNFRVLVHPGDSLYVVFDGATNQRVKILRTVKYSGSAAELNQQLSQYLLGYFINRPESTERRENVKVQSPTKYICYEDSIRKKMEHRRDEFINDISPLNELVTWINTSIWIEYYEKLLEYPLNHLRANGLSNDWDVGESYWDFLDTIPDLTYKTLIYGESRWLINRYLQCYIWDIAEKNPEFINNANKDSILIHTILENAPLNGLIKQLTLSEFVNSGFSRYDVSTFEEHSEIILGNLNENFIKKPTIDRYKKLRNILDEPPLAKEVKTYSFNHTSASELWAKILEDGKNNVLYIDCWATWCGACLSEFTPSKLLMNELINDSIDFIYLCFKSEKEAWKTIIADKQLKGSHYFLNEAQSSYFQDLLSIVGYPTYIIIDKEGKIVRNGFSFRPSMPFTSTILRELIDS